MKGNKKEIIIGAIIIGVILISAIAVAIIVLVSDNSLNEEIVKTLTLDQLNIAEEIIIGEEKIAALTAITKNVTEDLVWTSSNTKVATVEGAGNIAIITLKEEGRAVITVAAGDLKAECQVTVKGVEAKLTLTPNSITEGIVAGKTKVITIAATLENLEGDIIWSVDNDKVATIVGKGETADLTLKGVGNAVVTAKVGDKAATCNVKVNDVTSMITLNMTSITEKIKKGATVTKTLEVKLLNVTGNLNWTSSNEKVAKVEKIDAKKAKVTVVGEGIANITVTDGTVKATCSVRATQVTPSLTLNKTTIKESIIIGNQETIKDALTATLKDGAGTITWESSNEKVATVNGNGNKASINVLRSGTTTITAKCIIDGSTYKATCIVGVSYLQPSLTLNKESITESILAGGNKTLTDILTATLKDAKGSIIWKSSDDKVVSVVPNGMKATLKLNKSGTAIIEARYSEDGIVCIAECKVTVNEAVPSVILNKTSLSDRIVIGQTKQLGTSLTATLKNVPDGTEVNWTTNNATVATVPAKGTTVKVTAVGAGTAIITANITVNGIAYSQSCTVNITYEKPELILNEEKLSAEIVAGQTYQIKTSLTATLKNVPAGTEVNWTTNNAAVATVPTKGTTVKVTAVGAGTAIITANIKVNGTAYSQSCTVTVTAKEPEFKITSGDINVKLVKGGTKKIKVDYSITNVSEDVSVKWESSNPDVVSVNKDQITVKAEGIAKLKGSIEVNGKTYSDTCIIDVYVVTPSITINPSAITKGISPNGETEAITATLNNASGASIGTIYWESSNTDVVSVPASGEKVTLSLKAKGTATITARCEINGINYYGTCTVTLSILPTSIEIRTAPLSKIQIGQSHTMYIQVNNLPEGQNVSWHISGSNILSKGTNSNISLKYTGKKVGKATITASANGVSKSWDVEVVAPKVEYVVSDITTGSLGSDKECKVQFSTYISNVDKASGMTIEWLVAPGDTSAYVSPQASGAEFSLIFVKPGTYTVTARLRYNGDIVYANGSEVKSSKTVTITD